jgi:hypothetical protein
MTSDGGASHLQEAVKAAASAAAVGAAVGAARAYSARRHPADESDAEPEPEPVDEEQTAPPDPGEQPKPEQPVHPGELQEAVAQARRVFQELHGEEAESISHVSRTNGGWVVGLEVVEVRRIPDSTDVLATYDVELDYDGGIRRFQRVRRYHRSEADRGGRG